MYITTSIPYGYIIYIKEELYILTKEYLDKLKANELPKKNFSKEKIALMNSTNLEWFVLWYDSTLIKREDKSCRLVSNHSIVLNDCFAFDFAKANSNKQGEKNPCRPLDFCVQYLGFTFCQALYLMNEYLSTISNGSQPMETKLTTELLNKQMKDGRYVKAVSNKQVYAYLLLTRKIDPLVIRALQHQECLYAEVLSKGYNVAFPLFNDLAEIVGFELCGVLSNKDDYRYKGSVVAEPNSCFYYVNTPKDTAGQQASLFVFESAIDVASFMSLVATKKVILPKGKSNYMISLRGLHYKILAKFIDEHPDIDNVNICVDCDKAGKGFFEEVKSKVALPINDFGTFLQEHNAKDWNELLTNGTTDTLDLSGTTTKTTIHQPLPLMYEDVDDDNELPF